VAAKSGDAAREHRRLKSQSFATYKLGRGDKREQIYGKDQGEKNGGQKVTDFYGSHYACCYPWLLGLLSSWCQLGGAWYRFAGGEDARRHERPGARALPADSEQLELPSVRPRRPTPTPTQC
jgi:hypothetical protein